MIVCVFGLDTTNPLWWREKVVVYYIRSENNDLNSEDFISSFINYPNGTNCVLKLYNLLM